MTQRRQFSVLYTMTLFLALCVTLPPAEAAAQEYDDDGEAPEFLQNVFEELRIGVRLTTDVQRWSHTASGPLDGVERDGQAIDARLQPAALTLYGMEAGLAYRNVEVFGTVKVNKSLQPTTSVQTQNGTVVTDANPDVAQYGVRAQYLKNDVVDGLSIGAGIHYRVHQMNLNNQTPQSENLLTASLHRNDVRLYVPVQYDFGNLKGLLTVGAALTRDHFTFYESYLDVDSEPGNRDVNPQVQFTYPDGSPRTVFATVGVETPVWGMPLQATVRYERAQQADVYTESTFGMGVRVGLPF